MLMRRVLPCPACCPTAALPATRCDLPLCHIRWLGLKAFRKVLGRKQAAYRLLLAQLDAQLALPVYSRHLPRQLAAVVAEPKSAVFNTIPY